MQELQRDIADVGIYNSSFANEVNNDDNYNSNLYNHNHVCQRKVDESLHFSLQPLFSLFRDDPTCDYSCSGAV